MYIVKIHCVIANTEPEEYLFYGYKSKSRATKFKRRKLRELNTHHMFKAFKIKVT